MWIKLLVIIGLVIAVWAYALFFQPPFKYQLSISAIFRDEAPYLREWIEFHRLVGVEHFYLCSHNSQDHYKEVLAPYIQQGIVELTELVDPNDSVENFTVNLQCGFYNECLKRAKGESRWVAFIDTDEFLFSTESMEPISIILKDYQRFAGVCVNWQLFGTSDVDTIKPHELLIERLICCAPKDYQGQIFYNGSAEPTYSNRLVKSIVQPKYTTCFINPHFAIYKRWYYQVTTDGTRFTGPHSPFVQIDKLRINHYWTRDEAFFLERKMKRQQNWWKVDTEAVLAMKNELNQTSNTLITRYAPQLKEELAAK